MREQNKKIVSVEILHLDEPGYGPEGKHTRTEWRAECLQNLLAGKQKFEAWQQKVLTQSVSSTRLVVSTILTYSDNTQKIEEQSISNIDLDFIGQTLPFLSLDRHQFLLEVRFDYATFESEVSFRHSTFDRYAWFRGATFKKHAYFSHATFIDKAAFKDGDFSAGAYFNKVIFSKNASFKNANFLSESDFTNTTFLDDVDFYGACLVSEATFLETKFNKNGLFLNTVFKTDVRFTKTTFNGVAYFNCTIFEGIAYFVQAHFINDVYFFDSIFKIDAYFGGVTFNGDTRFNRAKFLKIADFNGVIFHDEVNFSQVVFDSTLSFVWVKFYFKADFESATFNNVGHFEKARFLTKVPAFRGCKIDDTRLEFSETSQFPQDDFSEDAIKNISCLKRLSDEHGQTDQALNFNAIELRAKRKNAWQKLSPDNHQDAKHEHLKRLFSWRSWVWLTNIFKGDYWFCVFTWLYDKCSDFGRSYTRPLFLLMALNLITFFLCICIASQQGGEPEQTLYASLNEAKAYGEEDKVRITAFRAASEYSIYKTGNFLDFSDTDKHTEIINQRLFGSEIEPSGMRFYGFFKGLLSAILIFLIGLGIRNKYRVS